MPHKPTARVIAPRRLLGSTDWDVGAAICTVKRVGAPELPGMTVGGLKVPVAPDGSPVENMVTTLSNAPPTGRTLTSIFTAPPCATVTDVSRVVTVNVDGAAVLVTVSGTTFEVELAKATLPE